MLVSAIYRGFDRLLISFSLSHTHRKYLDKFAMSKLHKTITDTELFLYSLALLLTCMYTERDGNKQFQQHQLDSQSRNTQPQPFIQSDTESAMEADNIERLGVFFAKLQNCSSFEAEAITKYVS